MQYHCGCVNEVDPTTCALRSIFKCVGHQKRMHTDLANVKLDYYLKEGGLLKDGIPQNFLHIAQLRDALDEMGITFHRSYTEQIAYDVGAGLGSYAPFYLRHGYDYQAIEPCHVAARWIEQTYCSLVHKERFETVSLPEQSAGVVQMAHSLEHFIDAPAMLAKAYRLLKHKGILLIVVPNGEDDPTNPDHLWFFTDVTLRSLMEQTGFHDVRIVSKRIVQHERFLYAYGMT